MILAWKVLNRPDIEEVNYLGPNLGGIHGSYRITAVVRGKLKKGLGQALLPLLQGQPSTFPWKTIPPLADPL